MRVINTFVSVAIAQGAGIVGSLFTAQSVRTWYLDIMKPEWNPPSFVFGPVWITLYTLIGIAASLVWERRSLPGARKALYVYGFHLVLNALWSVLFFGLKNPGAAFAEIIVLLFFILLTTVLFWRINKWAGILMIPYILWVSFATYLNYTIWQLN